MTTRFWPNLSYWGKVVSRNQPQTHRQSGARHPFKMDDADTTSLPLNLEKIYCQEDLKRIFSNVGAFQLTYGCSHGCPMCGIDAVKKSSGTDSFSDACATCLKNSAHILVCIPMKAGQSSTGHRTLRIIFLKAAMDGIILTRTSIIWR